MICGHCKASDVTTAHVRSHSAPAPAPAAAPATGAFVRQAIPVRAHVRRRAIPVTPPGSHQCDRCAGSGIATWGGTVNGRPVKSGTCFRCQGKGVQTTRDQSRNRYYDNHAPIRY